MYNKPAKSAGGVIGITRRKEAMAIWEILRHDKEHYTSQMRAELEDIETNEESETSLHYEFNPSTANASSEQVQKICEHLSNNCNPLSCELNGSPLRNIASGEENEIFFTFVMSALAIGEQQYTKFVESRLASKK